MLDEDVPGQIYQNKLKEDRMNYLMEIHYTVKVIKTKKNIKWTGGTWVLKSFFFNIEFAFWFQNYYRIPSSDKEFVNKRKKKILNGTGQNHSFTDLEKFLLKNKDIEGNCKNSNLLYLDAALNSESIVIFVWRFRVN